MFNPLNQYDSLGAETEALDLYRAFQTAGYGSEVEGFRPDLPTDNRGAEFFGLEEEETDVWVQDQFGGWNPIKAISRAASSVAKAASSVVSTAAKVPGISSIVAAPRAALNIAQGKNVLSTLKTAAMPPQLATALQTAQRIARGGNIVASVRSAASPEIAKLREQARTVARNAAFIPGVGTAVGSGLSGLVAASQGKNLRQIAEEAAIGAVPGGQLYAAGIRTAVDVARGGNVLKSVASRGIEYGRTQLPGGEITQRALNVGLNVARGGNVAQSVAREGLSVAQRALGSGIGLAQFQKIAAATPLANVLSRSDLVKVGPNGASIQFPGVGVPPSAAIATMTAISEAAESTIPGVANAARQVLSNTKAEADRGNQGAAVALGAIEQNIKSRLALRNAKAAAARKTPAIPTGYRAALVGPNGQIIWQ